MTKEEFKKDLLDKLTWCKQAESHWNTKANADMAFFHADCFNKAQWGTDKIQPKLTINKTAQHVLNIENKARQYRMGIKVNPYGYGAENVVAEALEGLIRHIMNRNNAQQNAIMKAIEWQVRAGLGWIEVGTEYVNNEDFDQDFVIKPILDATKVYPDPYVKELDYSDMKYCFIEEEISPDEFKARYNKEDVDDNSVFENKDSKGKVKITRAYVKEFTTDVLFAVPMAIGGYKLVFKSMVPKEIKSDFLKEARENNYKKREIRRPFVKEYTIYKENIIDEKTTPFKHIPMVPFVGLEHRGDDIDRYGIVRPLRDPQNMLNIAISEIVEQVHLQPKARFLTPIEGVDEFLDIWKESNISNRTILPYRATDLQGRQIPLPQRLEPPMISEGLGEIVKSCIAFMEGVTGQTDVQMTESKAVITNAATAEAKDRVTLTATYHYTDNQARALKLLGEILLESIPIIYDSERIIECSLDYGFTRKIVIDQKLEQASNVESEAMLRTLDPSQSVAINPTIGKYNVVSDVGVNYQTERQKAFDGIYMLIQTCPTLAPTLIPYLLKASDYPLAQEMALKVQEEPPPEVKELQEQIAKLSQTNQELELEKRDKAMDYQLRQQDLILRKEKQDYEKQVAQMDQETKRRKQSTDAIAAMGSIDPSVVKPVLEDTVVQFEKQLASPYGTPKETILTPVDNSVMAINDSVDNSVDNIDHPQETQGMPRLASLNPPGGVIHEANPVIGAIKEGENGER